MFSPPPGVSDPDMHHGTCVLWSRRQGKRPRHSRRMHNPQFYVSGKRPIMMHLCLTFKKGNVCAMVKLASQFTNTATLMAADRALWGNISDTRNHGMEPVRVYLSNHIHYISHQWMWTWEAAFGAWGLWSVGYPPETHLKPKLRLPITYHSVTPSIWMYA